MMMMVSSDVGSWEARAGRAVNVAAGGASEGAGRSHKCGEASSGGPFSDAAVGDCPPRLTAQMHTNQLNSALPSFFFAFRFRAPFHASTLQGCNPTSLLKLILELQILLRQDPPTKPPLESRIPASAHWFGSDSHFKGATLSCESSASAPTNLDLLFSTCNNPIFFLTFELGTCRTRFHGYSFSLLTEIRFFGISLSVFF